MLMQPSEKGTFAPKRLRLVRMTEIVAEKSDFPPNSFSMQLSCTKLEGLPLSVASRLFSAYSDSHVVQLHTNTEIEYGTPMEPKPCKCKRSRCLQLYCECFASGTYCDGCNCMNCKNNFENEAARRAAVETMLDRKPSAFMPKIASGPRSWDSKKDVVMVGKHNKGCQCKRSGCLKRYCECFQATIPCSGNCKCLDCKNFKGLKEQEVLYNGNNTNTAGCIQRTNAAITSAIGSSGYKSSQESRKRKDRGKFFCSNREDPSICRRAQYQQELSVTLRSASTSGSHLRVHYEQIVTSEALGTSKFNCSSLLASTIHPQDMRELCSILVVVTESARILADKNGSINVQTMKEKQTASFFAAQDTKDCQQAHEDQKATPNDLLSGNQVDIICKDDPGYGDGEVQKEMPVSPGTLALICGEGDELFNKDTSSDQIMNHGCNTNVYVEQERLVLNLFCQLELKSRSEMDHSPMTFVKPGAEKVREQEFEDKMNGLPPHNAETSPTSGIVSTTF